MRLSIPRPRSRLGAVALVVGLSAAGLLAWSLPAALARADRAAAVHELQAEESGLRSALYATDRGLLAARADLEDSERFRDDLLVRLEKIDAQVAKMRSRVKRWARLLAELGG